MFRVDTLLLARRIRIYPVDFEPYIWLRADVSVEDVGENDSILEEMKLLL